MNKSKKESLGLQAFLYYDNPLSTYARITNDLVKSDAFQILTPGEKLFYIILVIHSFTEEQVECLYNAIKKHHDETGEQINDFDLKVECGTYSRKNYGSKYFVFPAKHAAMYGYTAQNSSKNIKALIKKGFVKKVYFDKGHYVQKDYIHDFERTPTVYQFSDKWKKIPVN